MPQEKGRNTPRTGRIFDQRAYTLFTHALILYLKATYESPNSLTYMSLDSKESGAPGANPGTASISPVQEIHFVFQPRISAHLRTDVPAAKTLLSSLGLYKIDGGFGGRFFIDMGFSAPKPRIQMQMFRYDGAFRAVLLSGQRDVWRRAMFY